MNDDFRIFVYPRDDVAHGEMAPPGEDTIILAARRMTLLTRRS
jgi:hypothetical protein